MPIIYFFVPFRVLSDAQERAWYDRHRDEILRGRGGDYEEERLDVFQFFARSCFSGFDDEEKVMLFNFYS